MSGLVVDASVGIKWFVPEVHSSEAARLRNPTYELHLPGLFDVEVANIVWKKIRRGELSRQEGNQLIAQIALLPIQRHPDLTLVAPAFDLEPIREPLRSV